jgi:hypothetical protein
MKTKRRRKATRKQLAALAKGRAALRKLRNPKRRHRRASRKASARRRSRLPHKNPIGIGEILTMSNPKRRRSRHKRSHRRHHHRRRSLTLFRNPGGAVVSAVTSGPREVLKGEFIKDALAVSAGFMIPNQVLMRLPASMINSPVKAYLSKAGLIVVGAAIAGKVGGPKARRGVLLGGALGLAVDLWTDYVSPMIDKAGSASKPAGTAMYYGEDRQLGAYYGERGMGGIFDGPGAGEAADLAGALEEDI